MTEDKIRAILSQMAQSMDTQAIAATVKAYAISAQAYRDITHGAHEKTMASRLRNFTRMNPPIFCGYKVDEGPQEFIHEVYKIVCAMGLSSNGNADFASHQRKDMARTWHAQWIDNRPLQVAPVTWEIFKRDFFYWFSHREMREAKFVEFINLCQGGMGVHDYSLKFIEVAKYAPSLISNPRDQMS
ncbi:uncharacterized protein [Solanum lycopersicum]|uniref:uncharacterized protein n=1 Tax=Solanum lycopersicum TaxID=4081 RepID=UPI003747857D